MKSYARNLEETPGKRLVKLSLTVDESEFDRDIDQAFRKIARRDPLARVSVPARCRARCSRPASAWRLLASRRCATPSPTTWPRPCASTTSTSSPPRRSRSPAAPRTARSSSMPRARCAPRSPCPATAGCGSSCRHRSPPTTRSTRRCGPSCARHGSLVDVDRPVQSGDHVTLTLAGTRDGEPVAGLNTEDWLYEVGKGWVAPGFDDELLGAVEGAELSFSATPNGTDEPADFEVTVTNVQEMVLPELTDEWVDENIGEFDTVDALPGLDRRAHRRHQAQPGPQQLHRSGHLGARRTGRRRAARAAWCRATCRLGCRTPCSSSRRRASARPVAAAPPVRTPHSFIDDVEGAVGEGRQGRPGTARRRRRRGHRRSATTSSTPSTRASPCRSRQKKAQVARPTRRTTRSPTCVAQMRKTKALDWLLAARRGRRPDGDADRPRAAARARPRSRPRRSRPCDHDHDHDHDHDSRP